jgi:lysophospholipase L1-like esterase
MVSNWATYADVIVRIDSNAYIGDAGNPNNTTYYQADKIHLTPAGYSVVAGLVTTAIQGLG